MQRYLIWGIIGLLLLGQAPLLAPGLVTSDAFAQRSGGGVGGRGGFSTPRAPSVPRVNPSPSPSFPVPTPRSYPTYPTYPGDYYPRGGPVIVTPGAPGIGGAGVDIIGIIFIGAFILIAFSMVRGLSRAGQGGTGGEVESTVARLRIATLYSRQLQDALKRVASDANTTTTKGLADLIDNTAVLMLRYKAGWRFGSYETWTGGLTQAEGQFDRWMTEARSEFVETFRKFEGKTEINASYEPKAEPDGRYILVTFVVAAHGTLPQVQTPVRAAEARAALMALASTTPVTTLATYITWTPEAGGEALTEEDLLTGWSGLELL
ncbi:MAG: DUF1517 domain-containing protein [Meiothermus sp.]|nr:DUF1517 domain-containing protein [Meiothermus sp.]